MTPVRIAVVDAGDTWRDYVSAGAGLPHVQIRAMTGREATAAASGSGWNPTFASNSFGELLDQHAQQFDAVVICSGLAQRPARIKQAAQAGKHVLVASPMAATEEEARAAADACACAGVRLLVGPSLRHRPYQRTVHESLERGELGSPGLLRIHHWTASEWVSPNQTEAHSVSDRDLTIASISEEIDVACWLFQATPDRVYTVSHTSHQRMRSGVQLHLGFPEGGMALIDRTSTEGHAGPPYYLLTLIGARGAAYADDHHNMNLVFRRGVAEAINVEQGKESIRHQLREFASAIRTGQTPDRCVDDAQRCICVAQAALASLESGQVAHWEVDHYELA